MSIIDDEEEMKDYGLIEIDGVNVAECCALDKDKKCDGKYDCENEVCAYKYNLLLDENNKIKAKLQRLKKENEKLKKEVKRLEAPSMIIPNLNQTGVPIEEYLKLKTALEKIRDIAKTYCDSCQEFEQEHNETDCIYCNYGNILTKINEVLQDVGN